MTLTFPNSPTLNDTYIYKDKVYKYDGKKWVSGFLNNNSISTEYIDFNSVTPTPEIDLDLRKYNFFELNLGTSPNLFSYPEDFTKNPPWIITGLNGTMVGGQTELTPDYTQTADKITENSTASATRIMYVNADFVKGTTYTVSMYVKRASGTRNFGIVLPLTAFGVFIGAAYDLGTGTYTLSAPTGAVNASAKITNEGNGWYRCSITATATISSSDTIQFRIISGTDVYETYTGDGTSALYWWAAKLEVGNLTNYIPPEITNKLKYSEQFSNSVWDKLNTTITDNQISAPDGTLTADLLLETNASGQHSVSYTTTIIDLTSRNYTYSIYVKKYNRSRLLIKMANNAGTSYIAATINLDTVTATLATSTGSGVADSCSITPDIDNWYRISLTGRTGVNEIQAMQLLVLDDTGTTPYTGDITKGVYVWGAQLQKDTLTNYQKVDTLAYYNVNLIETSENDMFLLKIKNQIKPDFNLDLTTPSAMPYDNENVLYTLTNNGIYTGNTNAGYFVSPDGMKTYTAHGGVGSGNITFHSIYQHNLSTPWNLSNAHLSQGRLGINNLFTIDNSTNSIFITGIYISNDGTNMYVCRKNTSTNIHHYVLPNPWNIVTAVLFGTYSITQAANVLHGITFKPDGTSMYILGGTTDTIYEYNLSSPWRLDTATYTAGNAFSVSTITAEPYSLQFSPDGTKLFFMSSNNDRLYQLDLSTAWKINTAVNNNKFVSTGDVVTPVAFAIKPDGLKTFVLRDAYAVQSTVVYQYSSSYLGSLDYTITWPTNIKWDEGSPPSITKSNQNTLIEFYKYNGIWNAKLLANDI